MNPRTVLLMISLGILAIIISGAWFYFHQNPPSSPVPTYTPEVITTPTSSPETEATSSATPSAEPLVQTQKTIKITASGFEPKILTIKVGEEVIWINQDTVMHNVSSDPHPVHTNYPPLNLGNIQSGQSKSLTFNKTGIYTYHDHLNPTRKGTIIVK